MEESKENRTSTERKHTNNELLFAREGMDRSFVFFIFNM